MKRIRDSFIATILIFFLSFIVIAPIIEKIGYSSIEGSYHAVTHALLVSLIFIVLVCTGYIVDKLGELKEKRQD